jgi:hypothetical protein
VYSYDQTTRKTGEKIVFIHSQEDCREKYQKLAEDAKSGHLASTTLIVARVVPDVVRIRLATGADVETDIMEPFVKSDAQFLAVEYTCRGMDKCILVDIPRSHYIVGNELLSTEYVLRYLEYLPIYAQWDFDESYKIRVVDDNLQKIELRSNQWIRLSENGYEVCSIAEYKEEDEDEEEEEETKSEEQDEAEEAEAEEEETKSEEQDEAEPAKID